MQSFSVQPVLSPFWLTVIAAGLLAMILIGPSFTSLVRRRRIVLSAIRTLVVLLSLTLLLRPGCVTNIEKQQKALVLIMLDFTRSMELSHKADDVSRWEKMNQMVKDAAPQLQRLTNQNIDVQFIGYDNDIVALESDAMPPALPASQPGGSETDIGTSLDSGIKSVRDQRLIGVFLLGDGVQNALDPRVELGRAVETLVDLKTPLYTVAFGPVADTGQFADVSVENMPDNYSGFVKNRQNIRVTMRARGFTNQNVPVELLITNQAGEEEIVDTKSVAIVRDIEERQVSLQYTPQTPGNYRLTVRIRPQPQEVSARNNELSAFMTIYDGGLRVLYLHGDFQPESKYIRWALESSGDIELTSRPILSRFRSDWPKNFESLFSDEKYDVFIIGDVDSSALFSPDDTRNLEALKKAVEGGRGLIMLGGYQSFGPGRYYNTPLREILPIQMDPGERQDIGAPILPQWHHDRAMKIRPTGPHYLLRLSGDDAVDGTWGDLPKLSGINKFREVKESAEILLESEFGHPVLVAQDVGGRVLAFAADSTYLWYLGGYREAHKRFWRQVVLWLAFRDGLTNDNVWLNLPQRRFEPGGLVEFSVGAKTASGDIIDNASFSAELTDPAGEKIPIEIARTEGRNWAQIPRDSVRQPGLYTIDVAAEKNSESIGKTTGQFMVFDRDKEKSNPAGDPDQLARMAQTTVEFGGKTISPEEFSGMLAEIAANPPDLKVIVPQKWQLGGQLRDGLIFLFVFVGLLASEWFLRKKWGLV